jgi:putative zinc finger/helix-turn-helix YgiT family protein
MRHLCPICGQDGLDDKSGTFVMAVPPNIPGGDIRIDNAGWQACSSCGEEIIPDDLSRAIENTRYQRLGLLSPEQIRLVRAKTGLNAVEMAQIIGAGDKSYTRWENGKSVQNKATDTLIRLIDQHHELFADINAQRSPDRESLIRNYFESLSTLKGSNHFGMAAHGEPLSSAACESIRSRLLELASAGEHD